MPDERLSRFRQFPDRRLDGADLVKWLSAEVLGVDGGILGWWLCYDADDALLAARPQSCLSYVMGADVASTAAAVASSGLVGAGVRAASRAKLLGGVPMVTSRITMRERKFNFMALGVTEPGWTVDEQLDGNAPRAPPPVAHWNRRATRGQEATPHAAASSSTRGTATTPFGDAALDAGAPLTRPTLPVPAGAAAASSSAADASRPTRRRCVCIPIRRQVAGAIF